MQMKKINLMKIISRINKRSKFLKTQRERNQSRRFSRKRKFFDLLLCFSHFFLFVMLHIFTILNFHFFTFFILISKGELLIQRDFSRCSNQSRNQSQHRSNLMKNIKIENIARLDNQIHNFIEFYFANFSRFDHHEFSFSSMIEILNQFRDSSLFEFDIIFCFILSFTKNCI